jgi:hypothetical protein
MNIYISKTSSRPESLFANSICEDIDSQASVNKFNHIDIYDIALAQKADIIILAYKELKNIHISKFIEDLYKKNITITTKILIIDCPTEYHRKNIANVTYIPNNTYYVYNEYFDSSNHINKGYVLIDLESVYTEKNEAVKSIAYPINKKNQIIMVNCPESTYLQNVGVANEQEMLELIAECDLFIAVSPNYIYDAINMGKKIITISKNELLPTLDNLSISNITEIKNVEETLIKKLRQYKISNIIKNKLK